MPIIDDAYLQELKNLCDQREGSVANKPPQEEFYGVAGTSDEADSPDQAFKKILRLVNVRERCTSELQERLMKESFSETAIEEALSRAVACGLVDDLRFAEALIRTRVRAGKGRQGIETELKRFSLEASEVAGWPEEFLGSEEDELARALDFLKRRPPTAKNKREAAYRKLATRGYRSDTASAAARLWFESQEDN